MRQRLVWLVMAVGLCVIGAAPATGVGAQEPGEADECATWGLVRTDDGQCAFAQVPTAEVPLVDARFPDGLWFVVHDPIGDVRSPAGEVADIPGADITRVWWRTGRLGRPLARSLERLDGIAANDVNLRLAGRYLTLVIEPAAGMIGAKPREETLLFGIASDVNGKPANDGSVSAASAFSPWNGIDTIHQAGQFGSGVFGAGSTTLDGTGHFVEYYNTGSGIWMGVRPDGQAYTFILPLTNVGPTFRVFSQAVAGETPLSDLVGGPFDPAGALPLDGNAGPPAGCLEVLAVDPTTVGDGTAPAALEFRYGGPPVGESVFLDLDILLNREPVEVDLVAAALDEAGSRFTVPLPAVGDYTIRDATAILEDGSDPFGWDGAARPLRLGSERFSLAEGEFGHLAGSFNCGRGWYWMSTADACAVIGWPPDPWSSGERSYLPDDELLERLDILEESTLRRAGDDRFSSCAVVGPDGNPTTVFSWFRHPVTLQEATDVIGPGLNRSGCTVTLVDSPAFDAGYLRLCTDPPSTSLFSVTEQGSGLFVQSPFADPTFLEAVEPFVARFSLGIRDDPQEASAPGWASTDWDADGIPNTQDRDPLNAATW